MSGTFTPARRALLQPFGEAVGGMYERVRNASDAELIALAEAAGAASTANCWFCIFDAAKLLLPEVEQEQQRRASLKEVHA